MRLSEISDQVKPQINLGAGPAQFGGPPRLLLSYGYPLLLEALQSLLERAGLPVAGVAASAAEAVRLAAEMEPEIAILDFEMPRCDALTLVRDIGRVSPSTRIIAWTIRAERECASESLRAGVKAYTLKTSEPADLLSAVREVARGGTYFCPEVSRLMGERKGLLTGRERQVVALIAEGRSTKQVAYELGISVKTADSHRTKIMDKLDIHETASLVRFAIRQGLVQA